MEVKELEWEISPKIKEVLRHINCGPYDSDFFGPGYTSEYKYRKVDGWHCGGCLKPIPKYILFQWKLLNSNG